MSFFHELKRRNVFKVAIAYAIAAWILIEITATTFPILKLPDWSVTLVTVLVLVAFPLTLIFAWAFELTPAGLKKEKDVDRSESITHVTGRKLDFAIIGAMAIAILFLLTDKFIFSDSPETSGGEIIATGQSIAVLPFVNISSDKEQEYFSDGITEEILNALASVKELKVAGRTSSFAFKGQNQDIRHIGDLLGVEHILEGSVRKSGTTVRITAQLVQVEDGFHLWSDTYDRELIDVFAIQDEIATEILKQLKARLLDEKPPMIESQRTDPEVYDLYLLAKQRLYSRTRKTIESAAELLDQAIAKDPDYAPAYAQRGIATLLRQQIKIIDFRIGALAHDHLLLFIEQPRFKLLQDFRGDFILNGEYVCQFAVVCGRPQVETILDLNELGGDPYRGARLADGTLEDMFHSQQIADSPQVLVLSFERE